MPSERELGQTYAVGRSSTREAIRVLESQGLVQADGRGGYRVMEPGNLLRQAVGVVVGLERVEIADLFEVRQTLEIESAGVAAIRRTEKDLSALESHLREMEAGLDDPGRYNTGDLRFHTALAAATGNRLTLRLMDAIRDAMSRSFAVAFYVPGSPEQSLTEHRSIAAAVRGRDPGGARAEMRRHLERVGQETAGRAEAEPASPLERRIQPSE